MCGLWPVLAQGSALGLLHFLGPLVTEYLLNNLSYVKDMDIFTPVSPLTQVIIKRIGTEVMIPPCTGPEHMCWAQVLGAGTACLQGQVQHSSTEVVTDFFLSVMSDSDGHLMVV